MSEGKNLKSTSVVPSHAFDELMLTVRSYAKGLRSLVKFVDESDAVVLTIKRAKTSKYYAAFRFMKNGQSHRDGHSVYITSEYGGKSMYNVDTWRNGKCLKFLKYNDAKRCLQVVFDRVAYYMAVDYEMANRSAADGRPSEEEITRRKVELLFKISKEFGRAAELSDLTPEEPDFRDAYKTAHAQAVDYETKHRIKYQDTRRVVFARLREIMEDTSSEYGAYAAGRIDAMLEEYPYDDARFAEADVIEAIRAAVEQIPSIAKMEGNLLSVISSDGRTVPYVYFLSKGASDSYAFTAENGDDDAQVLYKFTYKDGDETRLVASSENPDEIIYTIFDTMKGAKSTIAEDANYRALMAELESNKVVRSAQLMSGADESEQTEAEEAMSTGSDDSEHTETKARELSFGEKKEFAAELKDAQSGLVSLALEAAKGVEITDVYVYVMTEGTRVSYNTFYAKGHKLITLSDAQTSKGIRLQLLKLGTSDSKKLRAVYVKWGQPVPTETRMRYNTKNGAFKYECNYQPVVDGKGRTAATSFADWRRNVALQYR